MPLNKNSAIKYNNERGYSSQATKIIQSFVGAVPSGKFDNQTVQAVYDTQQSPLYAFKFTADGKVGPNTLGLIIMELEHVSRIADANVLRSYPYTIQGNSGEINPIESFTQWTSDALELRTDCYTWFSYLGVFNVKIKFSSSVDPKRYEYRQKIKGEAWSRMGTWNEGQTVWTPTTNWKPESDKFQVPAEGALPKGLTTQWKEDGQVLPGNKIERFGHRAENPTILDGLYDFYAPNQNGGEYVLKDTFGFQRSTGYAPGLRLWLEISYMGCVIDNLKPGPDKTIFSKQWTYKGEDTLK